MFLKGRENTVHPTNNRELFRKRRNGLEMKEKRDRGYLF